MQKGERAHVYTLLDVCICVTDHNSTHYQQHNQILTLTVYVGLKQGMTGVPLLFSLTAHDKVSAFYFILFYK